MKKTKKGHDPMTRQLEGHPKLKAVFDSMSPEEQGKTRELARIAEEIQLSLERKNP